MSFILCVTKMTRFKDGPKRTNKAAELAKQTGLFQTYVVLRMDMFT